MSWLVLSIVLSVVLTVLLNVGLRVFSGPASRRVTSVVTNRRVRVWVPWRGMIVGSLILTILVNLALRIA